MRNWNCISTQIVEHIGGENLTVDKKVIITDVASIAKPKNNSIMFVTANKWKKMYFEKLDNIEDAFIIIEPALKDLFFPLIDKYHIVIADNSRLYFAKALSFIIDHEKENKQYKVIEPNIMIGENVVIGKNSILEPFVFVDHDVTIGENVIIKAGAKIRSNTWIGDNVIIGENSVIAAQGFGVEKDVDGTNIRIPHVGGVRIGNGVEIGALTSIVAGTIYPTIIENNCFIDDLNHIAHNCLIEAGTLTTGCVEIGGSSVIGANGYISPNTTIRNGISLGKQCFVGQASSVQRSFGECCALVGSPAREFERKK